MWAFRRQRYVDFCWAARDIALLRLGALLSGSRGEEAAHQDLAQRYLSDGDIYLVMRGICSGPTPCSDAGPFTRSAGRNPKTLTRVRRSDR